MEEQRELMKTKDVQKYLGIGRDKAYTLMKMKSFPSTRLGKTYVVTKENLFKWLCENAGKTINL